MSPTSDAVGTYAATRTVGVLACLAQGPLSVPQLAERLGSTPRTARRLVTRLVLDGYVERVPLDCYRRRYRLTDAARELGRRIAQAPALPPAGGLPAELAAGPTRDP